MHTTKVFLCVSTGVFRGVRGKELWLCLPRKCGLGLVLAASFYKIIKSACFHQDKENSWKCCFPADACLHVGGIEKLWVGCEFVTDVACRG